MSKKTWLWLFGVAASGFWGLWVLGLMMMFMRCIGSCVCFFKPSFLQCVRGILRGLGFQQSFRQRKTVCWGGILNDHLIRTSASQSQTTQIYVAALLKKSRFVLAVSIFIEAAVRHHLRGTLQALSQEVSAEELKLCKPSILGCS